MRNKIDSRIPRYNKLIMPAFTALKELGGSGTNDEILNQVIKDLNIPDEVADITHMGKVNQSELSYQLAWARTYLSKYGVIQNSARSVWSITPEFVGVDVLDEKEIVASVVKKNAEKRNKATTTTTTDDIPEDDDPTNDDEEYPDEIKPWKEKLAEILQSMNPYGFERLTQRVLRECGFSQVEVTKKSGDGGIDGTGKLKINGIFSFNVAFQCKRYSGVVGAPDIRDFRGSLTTNIEKGLFITTGTFSKAAREEACSPGKQQIDLLDGEEFINKLTEYEIGVHPVTTYAIDEEFFKKI
ncbi:restriction endonuclease [Bariatricus sp. HCP28S3_C2]|uniref:restriction endonuclease n=1 Tax=unclassified Bariatricus TaxID=2677046 RepID=UPI003F88EF40